MPLWDYSLQIAKVMQCQRKEMGIFNGELQEIFQAAAIHLSARKELKNKELSSQQKYWNHQSTRGKKGIPIEVTTFFNTKAKEQALLWDSWTGSVKTPYVDILSSEIQWKQMQVNMLFLHTNGFSASCNPMGKKIFRLSHSSRNLSPGRAG